MLAHLLKVNLVVRMDAHFLGKERHTKKDPSWDKGGRLSGFLAYRSMRQLLAPSSNSVRKTVKGRDSGRDDSPDAEAPGRLSFDRDSCDNLLAIDDYRGIAAGYDQATFRWPFRFLYHVVGGGRIGLTSSREKKVPEMELAGEIGGQFAADFGTR